MLDLTLFAPLGLAVSAVEAVPKLASKGRARLVPQVGLARTVGKFAVDEACRRATRAARSRGWVPNVPWASPAGGAKQQRPASDAPTVPQGDGEGGSSPKAVREGPRGASATRAGSSSAGEQAVSLAIPSYDSLSAPQVVQRLAGLSREEIEAVRRYEAATRGRRTILARAEQLLS